MHHMAKVVALLAFRDEESYLPGFFAHLRNYVAEFIVLDDNSQDRSLEIARSQPNTQVLRRAATDSFPEHYFEVDNRQTLLETALGRKAEWVLCCDADERHEQRFLEQLQTLTSGSQEAFALRVRDLWDSCDQYRVDGFWEHKAKFVLFPLMPFVDYYLSHALHTKWVPPSLPCRDENTLDFNLYHLLSVNRKDRLARLAKFRVIDPDSKYQPKIGYDYLGDEIGIKVEKIASGRGFEVLSEDSHLCQ
jgi:glycosyltransferase involved in cell wall biosynthesis